MENVFLYFVAIGAGAAAGVSIVVLPIMWLISRASAKKGQKTYAK